MKTLPNKPSEILKVALKDLETVEAMPDKYKIDMNSWMWKQGKTCSVCHAGAVMACTLGEEPSVYERIPSHFDDETNAKLSFINNIREGEIGDGLEALENAGVISELDYLRGLDAFGWREDDGIGWKHLEDIPSEVSNYHSNHRRTYKDYILTMIQVFESYAL
jgi:cytochrome c551/c552